MILPKEIKTISILRALQLGDLLCAVPAFRALRENYPQAKISLIGLPNSQHFVQRFNSYLDDLIIFPGYHGLPEQSFDSSKTNDFVKMMNINAYDLVLQMHGNGTLVNALCNSFNPRYLGGFFPLEEPVDSELFMAYPNFGHEKDRHLLLLRHLGIKSQSRNQDLEFPITPIDESQFKALGLEAVLQQYVCIHPGSRNRSRQWPTALFSLIGDFVHQQGYQVIVTGTATEKSIADEVCSKMTAPSRNLTGETTIGCLAVLLKNSVGLISNCTGVSHIAAAIKTPSVVISMDGEPDRWGPPNKDLHYTHNWLRNKDYGIIEYEVKKMLRSRFAY